MVSTSYLFIGEKKAFSISSENLFIFPENFYLFKISGKSTIEYHLSDIYKVRTQEKATKKENKLLCLNELTRRTNHVGWNFVCINQILLGVIDEYVRGRLVPVKMA